MSTLKFFLMLWLTLSLGFLGGVVWSGLWTYKKQLDESEGDEHEDAGV